MSGQGSATKAFRSKTSGKTRRKKSVSFDGAEEKVPTDVNTQECSDENAMTRRMQTIASSSDPTIAGGESGGGSGSGGGAEEQQQPKQRKHTYIDIPVMSGGPTDRFGNAVADGDGGVGMQAALRQTQPVTGESSDIPEHIRKLLGPVEKSQRGKLRSEAGMDGVISGDEGSGGGGGITEDGPMPLWMERQKMAGAGGSGSSSAAAAAIPYPRVGPPMRPNSRYPPPAAAAANTSGADRICSVNVINHTDATLLMVAIDARTGQRVNKTLYPKQTDSFDAPSGCLISVINPVTERALFRHKVLEETTTLAVTDAVLLRDGDVGATGKWWDSKALYIAVGASVVAGTVGLALLIFFLVRRLIAAKAKATTTTMTTR